MLVEIASDGAEMLVGPTVVVAAIVVRTSVTISTCSSGDGVPLNQVWTRPSTTLSAQMTSGFPNKQLFQTSCRGEVDKVVNVFATAGEVDEYCSKAKVDSPLNVSAPYQPTPKSGSKAKSMPS